tara:strand:+ start:225 stop:1193 length:969 start_codon:yes stop_codon:yes gene_type:complete
MPLPASGIITLNDVNVELGLSGTAQIGMDDAAVRGLFGVASGEIEMSDGHGKAAFTGYVATGGTVTTDGDYKVHTFTSSGTFSVTQVGDENADFMVIAGGGTGGLGQVTSQTTQDKGGGGGAGGLRTSYGSTSGGGASAESNVSFAAGNYSIAVGAGGARTNNGAVGGASYINGSGVYISTVGGGKGGYNYSTGYAGSSGGSGGGLCYGYGGASGGAGTAGQGYAGGVRTGQANTWASGGGGAGGQGAPSASSGGVGGGAGLSVAISGTATTYAEGGDRGYYSIVNGVANTGGGGRGGVMNTGYTGMGNGGSGVVIIRYKFQ